MAFGLTVKDVENRLNEIDYALDDLRVDTDRAENDSEHETTVQLESLIRYKSLIEGYKAQLEGLLVPDYATKDIHSETVYKTNDGRIIKYVKN